MAGPAAAIARAVRRIDQVEQEGDCGCGAGNLEIAEPRVDQEGLVPAWPAAQGCCGVRDGHMPPCWITRINCSGATRIAAPVGHALTQAGPPSISMHMSHLTACLRLARLP